MIDLFKNKIKNVLESRAVRLADGSYGYLYKETISFFLNQIEELTKDKEIKDQIKTETEKEILEEIKEINLESEEPVHLSVVKKVFSRIKSWQEKLRREHRRI